MLIAVYVDPFSMFRNNTKNNKNNRELNNKPLHHLEFITEMLYQNTISRVHCQRGRLVNNLFHIPVNKIE